MMRIKSSGLLILAALWTCIPQLTSGEEPAQPKEILAKDLHNGKVQIVGLLGKPYGEILHIRGVWEAPKKKVPGKDEYPVLRITHVDGKSLADAHQLLISGKYVQRLQYEENSRPWQPSDVYEGNVYESGGYIREPEEVSRTLGKPLSADIYGFKFYTFLYLIDKPTPRRNQEPLPQTGAIHADPRRG